MSSQGGDNHDGGDDDGGEDGGCGGATEDGGCGGTTEDGGEEDGAEEEVVGGRDGGCGGTTEGGEEDGGEEESDGRRHQEERKAVPCSLGATAANADGIAERMILL